jgi:hypothetical protein
MEHPMLNKTEGEPGLGYNSKPGVAFISMAAIGGVLAAFSCCLPVLPFAAAAGVAGGAEFLQSARPYLLTLSVALIGYGFYQSSRTKACRRKPGIFVPIVLWSATLFVALSILFPQVMANAVADLVSR